MSAIPTPDRPAILAVFALTYLGIAVGRIPGLKLDRTGIAILGAIAMAVFSRLSTPEVIAFVNWPTVLLLFGLFVLSAQLQLCGFFEAIATGLARRIGHPAQFLFLLMMATAVLSAFLNHDIVCFVFTPIVADALMRRKLNPVPFLVALAIASNLGAAATVVGNPQNMMIAQVAGLRFGPYAAWCLVPVLFALGCAYVIIRTLSLRGVVAGPSLPLPGPPLRPFDRGHAIKGLVIWAIVIGLFFTSLPKEWVALAAAGVHLASPKFRTGDLLALVDWSVLLLFAGLFVVTGAFQASGYAAALAQHLGHGWLNLSVPANLAWITAVLSNLINNSAAVMLLLKVVNLSQPTTAYILALANSFGGSLIIVGSVSNIIIIQKAREMGINISFRAFARLGIPTTLAAIGGLIAWSTLMTAK